MKIDFPFNNVVNNLNSPFNTEQTSKKIPFSELLNKSLSEVNGLLNNSQEWNEKLALGQVENIHQVVIATQKAELAMQFTMQIRNKILDAYSEIMRMNV